MCVGGRRGPFPARFYTGAEPGAFRNHKGCGPDGKWEPYFVRRVWRRMNRTVGARRAPTPNSRPRQTGG